MKAWTISLVARSCTTLRTPMIFAMVSIARGITIVQATAATTTIATAIATMRSIGSGGPSLSRSYSAASLQLLQERAGGECNP